MLSFLPRGGLLQRPIEGALLHVCSITASAEFAYGQSWVQTSGGVRQEADNRLFVWTQQGLSLS